MGIYKFYGNQEYKLMHWGRNKQIAMSALKRFKREEPEFDWIFKTGSYVSFGGFDCKENRQSGYGVLVSLRPRQSIATPTRKTAPKRVVGGASRGRKSGNPTMLSIIGRIFR
jgi:hypothetical protein